jgi:hypothetical protein
LMNNHIYVPSATDAGDSPNLPQFNSKRSYLDGSVLRAFKLERSILSPIPSHALNNFQTSSLSTS